MVTGGLEVADVFRDGATGFLSEYGPMLSREQRGVLRAVMNCRTRPCPDFCVTGRLVRD